MNAGIKNSNPNTEIIYDGGWLPETIAYINQMVFADPLKQGLLGHAINTLIVDLKAAGVWSKMHAFYPFAGGDATNAKWNLKDPQDTDAAYRLTYSGGWTFGDTYAKGNASTGRANTHFNPLTDQLGEGQLSFGVRLAAGWVSGAAVMGTYPTTGAFGVVLSSNAVYNKVAQGVLINANNGHIQSTRESNTSFQAYQDGVALQALDTVDQSALPYRSANFYFGAASTNQYYYIWQHKSAYFASGITQAESLLIHAAEVAFQANRV